MDLEEFVGCSASGCSLGEWSAKAEERDWGRIPGTRKFLCPAHKQDGAVCERCGTGGLESDKGWTHNTEEGLYDHLCRACTRGVRVDGHGDETVCVTVEDYDFMDDSARVLEFGLDRTRLAHLHEEIGRFLYGAAPKSLIAAALARAAADCDGECGLPERECYEAHPIVFSAMAGNETHIDASVHDIAQIVMGVLAPEEDS